MFGLLLVAGHAVTVTVAAREAKAARRAGAPDTAGRWGALVGEGALARRWLAAATAGTILVLPVIILGYKERGQIGWIPAPGLKATWGLAITLGGTTAGAAILTWTLAVAGLLLAGRHAAPGHRRTAWLALPWLFLPPAILMTASHLFFPAYGYTYVLYCTAPLALLAGKGLAAIWAPPGSPPSPRSSCWSGPPSCSCAARRPRRQHPRHRPVPAARRPPRRRRPLPLGQAGPRLDLHLPPRLQPPP
jgi:hypothetical protein